MGHSTAAVSAAVAKVRHLAALPEIATKIIKIADDPDAGVREISDVVTRAPELSTRILKVVNSALYGLPGHVTSVQHAITLLGLGGVKNIAIAASLTRALQGPRLASGFSPRDLWAHGLAVAATTRMVALAMKSPLAEDAFLAGLLHDVGLMVELQYDRQKFAALVSRLGNGDGADVLAAETETFEATHQDFGAAIAEKWNLPRHVSLVAGWHHQPLDVPPDVRPDDRRLVTMVHVADRLVASCPPPFRFDLAAGVGDDVLDDLGLTRDQLGSIESRLPAAVTEAQSFLA